jgi:hypothetical protein
MLGSDRTGQAYAEQEVDQPVSTGFIFPFDPCLAPRTKEKPKVEQIDREAVKIVGRVDYSDPQSQVVELRHQKSDSWGRIGEKGEILKSAPQPTGIAATPVPFLRNKLSNWTVDQIRAEHEGAPIALDPDAASGRVEMGWRPENEKQFRQNEEMLSTIFRHSWDGRYGKSRVRSSTTGQLLHWGDGETVYDGRGNPFGGKGFGGSRGAIGEALSDDEDANGEGGGQAGEGGIFGGQGGPGSVGAAGQGGDPGRPTGSRGQSRPPSLCPPDCMPGRRGQGGIRTTEPPKGPLPPPFAPPSRLPVSSQESLDAAAKRVGAGGVATPYFPPAKMHVAFSRDGSLPEVRHKSTSLSVNLQALMRAQKKRAIKEAEERQAAEARGEGGGDAAGDAAGDAGAGSATPHGADGPRDSLHPMRASMAAAAPAAADDSDGYYSSDVSSVTRRLGEEEKKRRAEAKKQEELRLHLGMTPEEFYKTKAAAPAPAPPPAAAAAAAAVAAVAAAADPDSDSAELSDYYDDYYDYYDDPPDALGGAAAGGVAPLAQSGASVPADAAGQGEGGGPVGREHDKDGTLFI